MNKMDKLASINYLVNNNPVCIDCARGNLEQMRKAAGLYQVVKDLVSEDNIFHNKENLDKRIRQSTTF